MLLGRSCLRKLSSSGVAARWMTISRPSVARSTAARSVNVPTIMSAKPGEGVRSKPRTSWPRRTNSAATARPIRPLEPVTKTRFFATGASVNKKTASSPEARYSEPRGSQRRLHRLEDVGHAQPQAERDAVERLDRRRVLAEFDLREIAQRHARPLGEVG